MSIIYFSSNNNKAASKLLKITETAAPGEKIELYQSLEGLSKRLRQPSINNNDIAILFIRSIDEIHRICSIKYLSKGIRIILILPDDTEEMTLAAFRLYPIFISYIDDDFKDVSVVLKKIIKITDKSAASGC